MEKLTREQQKEVLAQKFREADGLIFKFLLAYAAAGLVLALFYDTWLIAVGVGAVNVLGFMGMRKLAPDSHLHRYFASLAFGVFMAQFIYQMHGLFEMHFFAFIGSAIMIAYQQWRMQIPITIFVVLHHGILAYLQYSGMTEVYFTQLSYMSIQTFTIHVILAAVVFGISGLWSYRFKEYSLIDAIKSIELEKVNTSLIQNNKALEVARKKLAAANHGLENEKEKLVNLTQKQASINKKLVEMRERS